MIVWLPFVLGSQNSCDRSWASIILFTSPRDACGVEVLIGSSFRSQGSRSVGRQDWPATWDRTRTAFMGVVQDLRFGRTEVCGRRKTASRAVLYYPVSTGLPLLCKRLILLTGQNEELIQRAQFVSACWKASSIEMSIKKFVLSESRNSPEEKG